MIGRRLKKIRRKLGLTQKEFATSIEISEATLRRYESGQNFPDAEVLERIADKYGVNIHWLVTGKGPMFLRDSYKNIEPELLEILTSLSPEHQRKLMEILGELSDVLCRFKRKEEK